MRARAEGFELDSVSVGTCRIEVRKRETSAANGADTDPALPPREAIYQQFGGELYQRMVHGAPRKTQVSGEDFQPAIEADQ